MSNIETFMTSEEISHLTQTEHKFVLKRACEALIKAGINPNDYWVRDMSYQTNKVINRLHLPRRECLLAINDAWYSDKAISEVLAVWNVWDKDDIKGLDHE